MLVRDVMNRKVARIYENTTMRRAAELASLSQASDLMVVDETDTFLGVLSEGDLVRAVMPDLDELISAGGSLAQAYRIFLQTGRDLADEPIGRLIIRNPITVASTDELLKVATVMVSKMIRRIPVVDEGRLVGTVSRSDVTWGLLSGLA